MKRHAIAATLTGVLLAFSLSVGRAQGAQMVDGQVTKIDESAQKITIKHGPLRQFDMNEPMTMVFRAADPAMLKTVKAGDKVKFLPERVSGQFTVTKIERVK